MLPLCSATTNCSCHVQTHVIRGLKSIFPYSKIVYEVKCSNLDRVVRKFSNGVHFDTASFKSNLVSCFHSDSMSTFSMSLNKNDFGGVIEKSHVIGQNRLIFVDNVIDSAGDDFVSKTVDYTDLVPDSADAEPSMSLVGVPIDPPLVSESPNLEAISLSGTDINISDTFSAIKESTANRIYGAQNSLNQSLDIITLSLKKVLTNANEAVDNVLKNISSYVDKSGDSAFDKLYGLSSGLKEASGKTGLIAIDVLRQTIVVIEDSLIQGGQIVGYTYDSAKQHFPRELQDILNLCENGVMKVLGPVGTAFQQVNIALEGIEESLGFNSHDPLIPIVLFVGLSATLWGSYRIFKYSGYAGDLSPQSTMELLRGNENVVLIDIRPQNLREKDGIPDLRRAARSRYASVTTPEVDVSVKKLLNGGQGIDDSLLAVVIRNLKIVEDRSKVLVMDVDGSRSKSVARSLRKLGTKKPYLVQGGFRSWVKEGFRVKELKPETALTILNEDAEAIFEEIKLTPLKVSGLGAVLVVASYTLVEWESTLQYIGVIGVGLTIFQRIASYQDADDFKQDVRLLLAPVRLGGEAISWAAGKLEPSRNGLPTSPPSSSDVQSRVMQAAAKHESQPSDGEVSVQDASVAEA